MKPLFYLVLDLVGSCNLRCPSCPQGNWTGDQPPVGFMAPELLRSILTKAVDECTVPHVSLYNWTEPFLHRDLPGMMAIVNSFGLRSQISSNLNLIPNLEAAMAQDPLTFVISTSGFTPVTYGYTHRRGDINKVKENMATLAKVREKTKATTTIYVNYHVYLHNIEEARLMKQYAHSLGFGFNPTWAFIMPAEKVLAYLTDDPRWGGITAQDLEIIRNLAVPLTQAVNEAQKIKANPCRLRDQQLVLDHTGSVQLCCAVFDPQHANIANYLEMPLSELQARRNSHPTCVTCMDHGLHNYFVSGNALSNTQLGVSHVVRERIAALEDLFNVSLSLG